MDQFALYATLNSETFVGSRSNIAMLPQCKKLKGVDLKAVL